MGPALLAVARCAITLQMLSATSCRAGNKDAFGALVGLIHRTNTSSADEQPGCLAYTIDWPIPAHILVGGALVRQLHVRAESA
jgi:hypothetical protein